MIKPAVYAAIGLVLATAAQTTGSVFGPGVTQGSATQNTVWASNGPRPGRTLF